MKSQIAKQWTGKSGNSPLRQQRKNEISLSAMSSRLDAENQKNSSLELNYNRGNNINFNAGLSSDSEEGSSINTGIRLMNKKGNVSLGGNYSKNVNSGLSNVNARVGFKF
jgi:hypothetical protein